MVVLSAELTFRIAHARSLKDKRQVCRSLIDGAKHKFNVAIAEVDTQDAHQTLTLGVAVVSAAGHHARDMLDAVIRYPEGNAQAELIGAQEDESFT